MNKISVAIATFNEEENIAACLKSVRQVADEVVIVDGSSSDQTVQIAQELGAKVIETENQLMFHINKNLAIDNCKNGWILVLDADERVTLPLAREIRRLIKHWKKSDPVGYYLNRKNLFLTRFLTKGGQYPDSVVRLFKKGRGKHPEISVHEQIQIEGTVGSLKNDLIHLANPTFTRYLTRENRYSSLLAKDFVKQNLPLNFIQGIKYIFFKPSMTFVSIFFRHRGYKDGFPGFVFAFFSGLHYMLAYIKYWEMKKSGENNFRKDWV